MKNGYQLTDQPKFWRLLWLLLSHSASLCPPPPPIPPPGYKLHCTEGVETCIVPGRWILLLTALVLHAGWTVRSVIRCPLTWWCSPPASRACVITLFRHCVALFPTRSWKSVLLAFFDGVESAVNSITLYLGVTVKLVNRRLAESILLTGIIRFWSLFIWCELSALILDFSTGTVVVANSGSGYRDICVYYRGVSLIILLPLDRCIKCSNTQVSRCLT